MHRPIEACRALSLPRYAPSPLATPFTVSRHSLRVTRTAVPPIAERGNGCDSRIMQGLAASTAWARRMARRNNHASG